jgi:hypothetical protein
MQRATTGLALFFQMTIVAASLGAMALWPPPSGLLLLVPVLHGNSGAMVQLARASGAALVDAGPLPGSIVVLGERARIARRIVGGEALIFAAPSGGCDTNAVLGAAA